MDHSRFLTLWTTYFSGAELPLALWYTNDAEGLTKAKPAKGHRCLICDFASVRSGTTMAFSEETVGCPGGRRYAGFTQEVRPDFEYFLSCGIPEKVEGERYKKSPELVRAMLAAAFPFEALGRYLVVSRWDHVPRDKDPDIVVFFAISDVLAGLFTLANYDRVDDAVVAPMGSGCASIISIPYRELSSPSPRAILGMFDVSARPCVGASELTFAVPWPLFVRMVDNMEESFLITRSWEVVRDRIRRHLECELR